MKDDKWYFAPGSALGSYVFKGDRSISYFKSSTGHIIKSIIIDGWYQSEIREATPEEIELYTGKNMNTQEKIEQLEKELAELKKNIEFKEGDWVKGFDSNFLFRFTGKNDSPYKGFNSIGMWAEDINKERGFVPEYYRKATIDEIKEALIKEAERIGFNNRVHVSPISDNDNSPSALTCPVKFVCGTTFEYVAEKDTLYNIGRGRIALYKKGKWAELIQSEIVVSGYKAEFKDGYVKFGCAKISNTLFRDALRFLSGSNDEKGNRYVTGIKIGEGLFTPKQIQGICEALK